MEWSKGQANERKVETFFVILGQQEDFLNKTLKAQTIEWEKNLKVTSHHVCQILFIRNESLDLASTQGE